MALLPAMRMAVTSPLHVEFSYISPFVSFSDMKTYFISGRAVPLADEMIYTTRGIGVRKHIPGLPAIGVAITGDKEGLAGAAVTATSPLALTGINGTKTSKSAEPLESSGACEGKMSQNKSFAGLLSPNGTTAANATEPTKSKSSFSLASKTYAMLSSSSSKLKNNVGFSDSLSAITKDVVNLSFLFLSVQKRRVIET